MGGHQAPLKVARGALLCYNQHQHSLTRKSQRSRLPRTAEEKASPLHVARVDVMDLPRLRERMAPSTRKRFDEVWSLTFNPSVVGERSVSSGPSTFSADHARSLCEHGIASKAEGPGLRECVPFTVVEEKETGLRQRFILWTRGANDELDRKGYKAQVPIGHISEYLSAVNAECASTRDFKTGFYAIEIPVEFRKFFRFRDADGEWWELTRLPMGHCCAPELMHTLAAVAAGHPAFVKAVYAAKGVRTDIWIDNVRYSGSRTAVERETKRLDATAVECSLTWKPSDTKNQATHYDFIGVTWDHERHRVSPSSRLCAKLLKANLRCDTAGALESLGGRLLHASAIAGVFPGTYWFAVKYLRRITNSLNRGFRLAHEPVNVPPSVSRELTEWVADVQRQREVLEPPAETTMTVFVDASLTGWGGVMVDHFTGEVSIVGQSWSSRQRNYHINELEALALLEVISLLPGKVSGGRLHVCVDNTSVAGVVRKKLCARSSVLNDAVVGALAHLRRKRITCSMQWVKSERNPADYPSRVPLTPMSHCDREKTLLAVRRFFGSEKLA